MAKTLLIKPETCTACKRCELACSFKFSGEFNPTLSRITAFIYDQEAFYIPVTCTQCDDPWCGRACPAAAISKDPDTGLVHVDEARCVGCKMCTLACPFGVISYNPTEGIVNKCELCEGDPECIKFCPTDCLTLVEEEVATSTKKKALSQKLMDSYREAKF